MSACPEFTHIKPKLWIDPETKEIWRLMPLEKSEHRVSYQGAAYEYIGAIEPVEIHFMEQSTPCSPIYRPFRSEEYQICPFYIEGISDFIPDNARMLNRHQFYCLYEAIAASASWWPICDTKA